MDIGKRIRQRRESLGITMTALGRKIGKDRTTIYRYESGFIEKLPTEVLLPIADALLTTPAYLMGWTDDPTRQSQTATNVNTVIAYNGAGEIKEYKLTEKQMSALLAFLDSIKE